MAEITGKIKVIGELQEFANNFTKVQVVITTQEQYPTDIPCEFFKEKTNLLDDYNIGDEVKIQTNIKGSEYQGKYYVNLIAWRIERVGENHNAQEYAAPTPPEPNYGPPADFKEENHDDLPF